VQLSDMEVDHQQPEALDIDVRNWVMRCEFAVLTCSR
jgi:hypothetical protein